MEFSRLAESQIYALDMRTGKNSGFGQIRVPTDPHTLHILVGLGGCGCDMLKEAKALIEKTCCSDIDPHADPERIVYLGIDTDCSDYGSLKSSWTSGDGIQVRLKPDTECLELDNSVLPDMLDPTRYTRNCAHYPHIMDWLDLDIRNILPVGRTGAAGIRQAGRICLFRSMDTLLHRISNLYRAVRVNQHITNINVFLLTGVSGGTGGGIFLDMAYILRHSLQQLNPAAFCRVFGYLAMPEIHGLNPAVPRSQLCYNGYAAMKELEHLMRLPEAGGAFHQVYILNTFRVDSRRAPFDHVYLVSSRNIDGPLPDNYYQSALASAAQNMLAFIASETPANAFNGFSMDALYDNIGYIVAHAGIEHPERCHKYLALGSAEFALPADAICKYALSLVLNDVNRLSANEPTPAHTAAVASHLALRPDAWLYMLLGDIPDPFPSTGNNRSLFAPDNQIMIEHQYTDALAATKATLAERVAEFEEKLPAVLADYMERAFTDPERGPFWVARLITQHLPKFLDQVRSEYLVRVYSIREDISYLHQKRSHIARRLRWNRANEYMQTWNDQFRLELQTIGLNYLCKDYNKDTLSTITQAIQHLHNLFKDRYGAMADLLTEVGRVARYNTRPDEITGTCKDDDPLDTVSFPQIRDLIDARYALQNQNQLVYSFLTNLLNACSVWSREGMDVNAFLSDYVENHLQDLTNVNIEHYLTDRFINTGIFPSMNHVLLHPGDLFNRLLEQARPLFPSSTPHPCTYILTVPANCPSLIASAQTFCQQDNIILQVSTIPTRIRIHCVSCAIALYHHESLRWYEPVYCNINRAELAGVHLRSFWTRQGQLTPPPGTELWDDLPAPIPARSRPEHPFGYPDRIRQLDEKRRDLFRCLVDTPAVRRLPNDIDLSEVDYKLYHTLPWEQCGIAELVGTNDSELMYCGQYDPRKILSVLTRLKEIQDTGLPPVVPGHGQPEISDILLRCWSHADHAARYEARKYEHTDAARFAELKEQACLQTAEEFFISSMYLCTQGEAELEKYRKLNDEIGRLTDLLAKLRASEDSLHTALLLFACESATQFRRIPEVRRFFLRDSDDLLALNISREGEAELVYQLHLKLTQLLLDADSEEAFHAIARQVQERYELLLSDMSFAQELQEAHNRVTDLLEECQERIRANRAGRTTESRDRLAFFEEIATLAESLRWELHEACDATPEEPPIPKSVSADVWICPCCGSSHPRTVVFCPMDGTKNPSLSRNKSQG